MKQTLRQLALGMVLMGGTSLLLLVSDWNSRTAASRSGRLQKIAIVQHNAQAIFDAGVAGMIAGLEEAGFRHGENVEIRKFNPYADSNLANAIAREVADGGYDLILTATTPTLQAVANANRHRRTPHIFALVSEPVAVGVGVLSMDSLEHPPHMTGYGTLLPAEEAIRIAYQINPRVQTIGTLWNTSEANSEVQIRDARRVCRELGIRLIEMNVENTNGVAEATASLIARQIDVLFVPGDVTVLGAVNNVLQIAERAGIPTFGVFPSEVPKGLLFAVGADYFEVGKQTGRLAAEVLRGRATAEIPITNYLPEQVVLNEKVRLRLRHSRDWVFPESLLERAYAMYDAKGNYRQLISPLKAEEMTARQEAANAHSNDKIVHR